MIKTVEGRYGPCKIFETDVYIGQSVINYGEYSPGECNLLVELANSRPGLVIDVGANIGCITQALVAAGHEVVAFEPQFEAYKLLLENCPTATSHRIALGDHPGLVYMPTPDYNQLGNFGGVELAKYGIETTMQTLDSFNFENVSLIKIDVEGLEVEVLRGAAETIKKYKPKLYVEADRPVTKEALPKILHELGYTFEVHQPPLFSEDNYFKNPKMIWTQNFISDNWLCKPKV